MNQFAREIAPDGEAADPLTVSRLRRFLSTETRNCRSEADLNQRLAALGYGLATIGGVSTLTTRPHGKPLCPAHLVGLPHFFEA